MSIWSRTATTNLLHHTTHECERALHRSRFWCVDTKILVRLLLQYRTTFIPNFNQTHNVYRISRPQRRISTLKSKTFNTTPKVTPDSLSLHLSLSSPLLSTSLHRHKMHKESRTIAPDQLPPGVPTEVPPTTPHRVSKSFCTSF